MRGYGGLQSMTAQEYLMDKVATELKIDPIEFRLTNALQEGDLTVTGDHGMVIDGLVINASALVNGQTIDWVPMTGLSEIVTVYHVETEDHDVILANGAPAETFVDYADRRSFENYDEYLALYGAERIIREMPRPRSSSARMVPSTIRNRCPGLWDSDHDELKNSA